MVRTDGDGVEDFDSDDDGVDIVMRKKWLWMDPRDAAQCESQPVGLSEWEDWDMENKSVGTLVGVLSATMRIRMTYCVMNY